MSAAGSALWVLPGSLCTSPIRLVYCHCTGPWNAGVAYTDQPTMVGLTILRCHLQGGKPLLCTLQGGGGVDGMCVWGEVEVTGRQQL